VLLEAPRKRKTVDDRNIEAEVEREIAEVREAVAEVREAVVEVE
jgi:hypothetical protein